MNLERDPDRDADDEATTEAQRIVQAALDQAHRIQVGNTETQARPRPSELDGDQDIADRLAKADREATDLVRHAVATAAELMAQVREEAARVAEEIVLKAQAEAELASQERLATADRLAAEVLLSADRLGLDIVDEARRSIGPTSGGPSSDPLAPLPPPPPEDSTSGPIDDDPTSESSRSRRRRPNLLGKTARIVLLVMVGVVGSDVVRSCVAEPYTVASTSMEPGLKDGNRLVVDKLAYRFGEVGRGDVVVFDATRVSDGTVRLGETLVKRVIGLPGDSVEAVGGVVLINGSPLDEPWLDMPKTPAFGPVEVPADSVFLLGDNRVVSIDSRTFGPVPADAIIGRVDAVLWPPGDAGPV